MRGHEDLAGQPAAPNQPRWRKASNLINLEGLPFLSTIPLFQLPSRVLKIIVTVEVEVTDDLRAGVARKRATHARALGRIFREQWVNSIGL